jgi:hypothetical protein
MNNSVVIDTINYIYDQKILELRNNFQNDIEKFNKKLISKEYFDYVFEIYNKRINDINLEKVLFLENLNKKLYIQDINNFLIVGERMKDLKSNNKKYYNYIVDKAFAINTPLSMFNFKYAGF